MTLSRPNPDALLAKVQQQEAKAQRGRLRIFFGAAPGVGKTFAMLQAARQRKAEGIDVVAGYIEAHRRPETLALLDGLEQLPTKPVEHRGKTLIEFDIDAALKRRPALILVDELAHTNAAGSRHPKRWQDIEELLSASIDVYTTVNVQHLESLNDVVGGITGIRILETVPDRIFDEADEVVLVDLSADELLARLKAGKVYLPQQVEHAIGNFFRKGNLMALREIALRRTADRVEDDVQAYRVDQSIESVWKTEAALLVCVGPDPGSERLVRSAARLANQLNVAWHAIYVETPKLQRLPNVERERILATLKLAEELEATTAVLASGDITQSVIDYARDHNLSKIVIGRATRRSMFPWGQSQAQRIAVQAPDIDLVEIGRSEGEAVKAAKPISGIADAESSERQGRKRLRYVWAASACLVTTIIATPLLPYFDLANIVMIFLLTVVLVAVKWGRGPAILAAFLSVASFDFFFVPPRFSFAVSDVQYLLTFAVMLAVGIITGQLTAGLCFQARVASHREGRFRALYEFARGLSSALQTEQVVETSNEFIQRTFRATATLLLPDASDKLQLNPSVSTKLSIDSGIVQWSFDKTQPAGFGTDTLPSSELLYLPLRAPMRTRGVLAIKPLNRRLLMIPEQRQQLETFAALIAIALERVHYVQVAQQALVRIESERLRNSLLATLSHDLRTPLTALVGLADSLTLTKPPLPYQQLEIAAAIRDESLRMNTLVNNLLDMAHIQSGEVKLNMQWQPIEEIVGSALGATERVLARHKLEVHVAHGLPLVKFDAVLIERVLVNLLENAAKYSPFGSLVCLTAEQVGNNVSVSVRDSGPGLPAGREEAVFEKFVRGHKESATPGVGLGLAICRAIVEAHGGKIAAQNLLDAGAQFAFTLPLETPPELGEVSDAEKAEGHG